LRETGRDTVQGPHSTHTPMADLGMGMPAAATQPGTPEAAAVVEGAPGLPPQPQIAIPSHAPPAGPSRPTLEALLPEEGSALDRRERR